jgi:hypothetical protein
MKRILEFILCLPLFLALAGCGSTIGERYERAAHIADAQLPIHALIHADNFTLASYARITQPASTARIYIEGDGLAWLGSREPSRNPTPTNPVALRLAALDPSPNLIWLARPCQYEGFSGDCAMEYWTSKRFAPEVVTAYGAALDNLKRQYGFTGFELIGFSGGGAITALTAAGRTDIISLRTVAGNLDLEAFDAVHQVSPMTVSLNPRDVAMKLSLLPQRHFIGGSDDVVPRAVYDSFASAAGNSRCLHYTIVEKAAHETGWEAAWPRLLEEPVACGR